MARPLAADPAGSAGGCPLRGAGKFPAKRTERGDIATSNPMSIPDDRPLAQCEGPAQLIDPLRQIARGSAWLVGARWSLRAIGLVNTIILARLLRPADFGIVAMAMVMIGFIRIFAETGQALAVIRHANPTSEHFDTAWTMSVCAGVIVTLILLATAPLAGWYFHEPRVVPVVRILALAPLIEGFTNIGAVAGFRKELAFDKEFCFFVVRKLSVVVVAVAMALMLRSYWAMVAGAVCGMALTVAASYWLHPYRPRFCLTKLRELWSFSAWTQLAEIGSYFGYQTDQIVVGGLAGALPMGNYNVASDFATAATGELILPVCRAMFPVYARLLHDPARLARSYLDILAFTAIIGLSTGVGVAVVAPDMVAVVLGPKWTAAAPLIPWLAVGGSALSLVWAASQMVSVTGHARLNAISNWMLLALLVPATVGAGLGWGVVGIAAARSVASVLFLPIMFYALMRVIPVTARQIAACLWRPTLASLAMAAAVLLSGTGAITPVALRLACNVGLGAAVFTAALLALWVLAGRPEGAERMAVAQLVRMAGRLGSARLRGATATRSEPPAGLAPAPRRFSSSAPEGSPLPAEAGLSDDPPLSHLP